MQRGAHDSIVKLSTGAIESVEVMVRVLLQERSWFVVGLLCCTKGGFWSQCAGLHVPFYIFYLWKGVALITQRVLPPGTPLVAAATHLPRHLAVFNAIQ